MPIPTMSIKRKHFLIAIVLSRSLSLTLVLVVLVRIVSLQVVLFCYAFNNHKCVANYVAKQHLTTDLRTYIHIYLHLLYIFIAP